MKKATYQLKSREEKEQEVQDLMDSMYKKMEGYTANVGQVKEYLNFMSNFYKYSSRNQQLIQTQYPGAQGVGSFAFFKEKGFSVRKGEKGIKIFVPMQMKMFDRNGAMEHISHATEEEKKKIKSGEIYSVERTHFKLSSVFDITQTNAKASDYPSLFPNRIQEFKVENNDLREVKHVLENIADGRGIQLNTVDSLGAVKGNFTQYLNTDTNEIKKIINLNGKNTPSEEIQVFVHELAHERLHNYERLQNENKNGGSITYSTEVKELQAEMTSYIVCHHIGMDTEDFSLPYIAKWTKNGDKIEDKIAVLKEVKDASSDLIEEINNDLDRSKNKDRSIENSYSVEKENKQQGYYTTNNAALSR